MTPLFSIIIPTHGRAEHLNDCLRAITELSYPKDKFEVIVVDDGSPQPLEDVVRPFKDRLHIQLIRQTQAGPAKARNRGAADAKGEFLVFTDDDCRPDESWLTHIENTFKRNPEALLGGKTINGLTRNLCSEASQTLLSIVYDHFNRDHEQAVFFASNNLAASRKRYLEIGGFDSSFRVSEDRELCERWRRGGGRLVYEQNMLIRHYHELSFGTFLSQHFHYGQGAYYFHRLRRFHRPSDKGIVDWGFYGRLLLSPFSRGFCIKTFGVGILIYFSQVVNIIGYGTGLIKSRCFGKPL